MFTYYWNDLKAMKQGQIVVVDVVGKANVKLMNYDSFSYYKLGLPYRYNGGPVIGTPCRIQIPYDGLWMLVVDTGFFSSFQVKGVYLAEIRQATTTVDTSKEQEAQPKKAIEIKNAEKVYVDSYNEAYQVLETSPKSCAFLCRTLVERLLKERCGCTDYGLEARIKTFLVNNSVPKKLSDNLHYVKLAGDTVAHTKEDDSGTAIETTKEDCLLLLQIIEMLMDFIFNQPQDEFAKLKKFEASRTQKK